jgi:hypothetical protein
MHEAQRRLNTKAEDVLMEKSEYRERIDTAVNTPTQGLGINAGMDLADGWRTVWALLVACGGELIGTIDIIWY